MSTRTPIEFATFPEPMKLAAPFGPYRAIVRNVVDGDTLDVLLDLGFNVYSFETLRVFNVNCPERNTPEGQRAKRLVAELLPLGTPVVVAPAKGQTFGRYVATVILPNGGDLATWLVEQGLGKVLIP